ncbi:hypothetical protein AB6A40_010869 [Gnathostoma spinigerum]|uniref:Uncharacterized protein n=1 Tax=Gnathostoma spinigerum TaxID=75299 RepID=A0ABD6EXI0_9BILA
MEPDILFKKPFPVQGRNPIGRSTAPSLDDQENTGSVDGRLSSSSVWSRASSVPAHRRPIAVTAKTPG